MFGRPYDEEGRPIIIKSDEDLAAEAMFKDETECPECGSDNVAWGCGLPDNTAGLEVCCWTCFNCGHDFGGDLK